MNCAGIQWIVLMLVTFSLSACKTTDLFSKAKKKSTRTTDLDSGKAKSNALFLDQANFSIDDIKKGQICGSVRNDLVTFDYHPWPKELANYFAAEMEKLPILPLILQKTQGLYLVTFKSQDSDFESETTGYTCQLGPSDKYVVFLNYNTIVKPRKVLGGFDNQSYLRYEEPNLKVQKGDLGLASLFHELFHVYDFATYIVPAIESSENEAIREAMGDFSWIEGERNKFLATSSFEDSEEAGFSLETPAHRSPSSLARQAVELHRSQNKSQGLRFVDDGLDAQGVASRLEFLRDKTNFLTFYAMENMIEDFAVTLERYYMTTRYQDDDRITVYKSDPNASEELMTYSPAELIKSSKAHREKVCYFVEQVLHESCN